MIEINGPWYHLQTRSSSYIIFIHESGIPLQVYYGRRLGNQESYPNLLQNFVFLPGTETAYSPGFPGFTLETRLQEMPGQGKGDYRSPGLVVEFPDGSRTTDLVFSSARILDGSSGIPGLPSGRNAEQTLVLELKDRVRDLRVDLYYCLYPEQDTIGRHMRIAAGGEVLRIHRAASLSLDLPGSSYRYLSLQGKWIREKQVQTGSLPHGITRFSSSRLTSSAEHNPGLMLLAPDCGEHRGECWGVSLVYSGNFSSIIERSPYEQTRVQTGISDRDFQWDLAPGEEFYTPQGVLSFSDEGLNGLSANFHRFITDQIIPPQWRQKERPLLFNSWEAMYFDFNQSRLLKLAEAGKKLGLELFVMDDGWFKDRNDDRSSLGDWTADKKKLPGGLEELSKKVRSLGLKFGIWVEPEMVSPDSDLYRAHPDWAIRIPDRDPSLGRNQLTLDLSNPLVVDHLEDQLQQVFEACRPDYVKWDMNRCASDLFSSHLDSSRQAELPHRYMLGLYELLSRICRAWPDTLFEHCASGGNRFDMGILYFAPQIWTSDNTDPGSRMTIQHGSSYFFPQHCAAAHVGSNPSHQVLRNCDLETRFHTAAFGVLGYELDLNSLSDHERKVIGNQVELYKQHRKLFQFGSFHRLSSPFESNQAVWQLVAPDGREALLGLFQLLQQPSPDLESIRLVHLDPQARYRIETLPHYFNIARFGSLADEYLPVRLKTTGIGGLARKLISDSYLFPGELQSLEAPGDELMHAGFRPWPQFTGTGYGERVRIMGDVSSRIYHIQRMDDGGAGGGEAPRKA